VNRVAPLVRIGLSILPNLGLGLMGFYVRAFDRSGLLAGVILGSVMTYAFGTGGFLVPLGFIVLGNAAARIAVHREDRDPSGGGGRGGGEPAVGGGPAVAKRTWSDALGNLAVPALGALLAILRPNMPVLAVFFTAALATAAFDSVASGLGKAFSRKSLTLHDLKVREAGVPGGISAVGTISGAAAAAALALVAFGFDLVSAGMMGYIVLAGVLATAAKSLLKSAAGLRAPQVANIVNTLLGGLLAALFWTGVHGV
jgi:uncharacterized protein (TIGR00297 family)